MCSYGGWTADLVKGIVFTGIDQCCLGEPGPQWTEAQLVM